SSAGQTGRSSPSMTTSRSSILPSNSTFCLMSRGMRVGASGAGAAALRGDVQGGGLDPEMRAAPADVAFDRTADLTGGRPGGSLEQAPERHDLSRRAEPALERVVPDERGEERVRGIPAERFDRLDRAARRLDGEHQAGGHGPAIDPHRACAGGSDPAPL